MTGSIVLRRTNGSAQRLWRQSRVALSVDTHQLELQNLQNRAARILTLSSYDAGADDFFIRLSFQKRNLQPEL